MAARARWAFRRSSRTAQSDNPPLGWVEIVHPFHPLRKQRLEVLKARRVSGVETLIVRHPEFGTRTVAREWTDWAEPSQGTPDASPAFLDFGSLLELVVLVAQLQARGRVDE